MLLHRSDANTVMLCPTAQLLASIGDRWSLAIVHTLQAGAIRYQALHGSLPGISTRTLSDKLKRLGRLGIVTRMVYAEVPPRVEYSLTTRGQALGPVLLALAMAAKRLLPRKSVGQGRISIEATACPTCKGQKVKRDRRKLRRRAIHAPPPSSPVTINQPTFVAPPPNDQIILL